MNIQTLLLGVLVVIASHFTCWGGVSRTWNGGGTNALASNPTNWVGDVAPAAGDSVIIDATTNKNMTWDLNLPVQSWYQVGYVGTVTVATVYGTTGFTNLTIIGDCTISNGVWTHVINTTIEANRLSAMIGGNLILGSNGVIDVTGRGLRYGLGAGSSYTDSSSYGGRGGGNSGPCYGSIVAPTNLGSGKYELNGDSYGGGAILLNVGGMVCNDGLISANGGTDGYHGTSAAGGSIWITSGTLSGGGIIRARGGVNGQGGGGRIAMVVTNGGADFSSFFGSISAFGNPNSGGAGTVYLRTATQGPTEGALVIDNNNATSGAATEINSNVTGTVVGDVLIQRKGYLLLATNQSLTLGGVWSNAASFASQWGSQVIFAGGASSTSTVYGTNTFMGLICTNGVGKTLLFQAGKTNTIPAQGRLTLRGSVATTNLVLRSTVEGTPWKLNVNAAADQSVTYSDVKDSDALSGVGAQVIAVNSLDRGGNTNWVFMAAASGETNTWSGGSNTIWSLSANWSRARPPADSDYILIPSAMPRYPVLDNHRTVNGLELQSGASLSLAGYNLTVTTNAVVAGALTASGTEAVTFQGDVNFTGGSITAARSTVSFSGSGSQSVKLANLSFFKLVVLNSAGTVSFDNGFTAREFRCEAASGTRSLTFQQGVTVTLRDLILLGSAATTNIMLRSSTSGQTWNLAVSGYRNVRGVDVQDSDASSRVGISALASKDSGHNFNWSFAAPATWLGTVNNNFHTAANWSPAGVPGSTTRVVLDAANPMTITGAVTVLDLTVGGGGGLSTGTVNAALVVSESITVLSNGVLVLNRSCLVSNDLSVLAGGLLMHSAGDGTENNKLNVTVNGSVCVDENGSVNVTGKGYPNGTGPGKGSTGSYGGKGSSGGPCYGSIMTPTNMGSASSYFPGGGVIQFTVGGAINNDGLICADGGGGDAYCGSGGSVYLTSGTLVGGGTIRANGGIYGALAGGGGRVALVVTNAGADFSLYTGSILATGGGTGAGAGTIYKQRAVDQSLRSGVLIVDNNNVTTTGITEINTNVTGTAVGDVLLRNGAYLQLNSNQTVTMSGIWSNGANFVSQWGSQVYIAGGALSTSTVYGSSTFMGLTCTNIGKTLIFQAGKTNTVSALGRLTLTGGETTNLMLRSTQDGTSWKLNVNAAAVPTIEYVDVKDSDAMTGVGAEITAVNSQDSGNNPNWKFVTVGAGETNIWTGASNTVWSAQGNWSLNRAPIANDIIKIPGSRPRYPVLDASATVYALEIQSGASLALAGYNLTIGANIVVMGALMALGTETVTLQGDVDFTGGTFTAVRSTVVLAGGGDQLVNLANLTFYKVMVLNSAGIISFGSGFAATEFRCEASSGTRNLVFQQGGLYTLRDLVLLGAVGNTNITLTSSSPGSSWNLAVSGYRSVRGVDVADSDGHLGLPIPATASWDNGNNINWTFGVTPSVWLGVSNSNFHTAANWSPSGVPGATTRVLLNSTNSMTITGAVTVLELTVGGGAGLSTGKVNAAITVAENMTVLSNGVLELNRPCVVSNGLYVLAGGLLTHTTNTTAEVNKLKVTVYGSVGVDENGSIDVAELVGDAQKRPVAAHRNQKLDLFWIGFTQRLSSDLFCLFIFSNDGNLALRKILADFLG